MPGQIGLPLRVCVLIRGAERQESLKLDCANRSVVVHSLPNSLSVHGQVRASFTFGPTDPQNPVVFDGRSYDGYFEVRPHPTAGLRLFNWVDLEAYVAGVVASEVSLWSARPAELEAQAIAARTYAVYTLANRGAFPAPPSPHGAYLHDTVADQVYNGQPINNFATLSASTTRMRLKGAVHEAVAQSWGQVITRAGRVEDVRFHASCGGQTSPLSDVFQDAPSGSAGTSCPCQGDSGAEGLWKYTFSSRDLDSLARQLGVGSRVVRIVPLQHSSMAPAQSLQVGRWIRVRVVGDQSSVEIPFQELRLGLGPSRLRSGLIEGTWPHASASISRGGGWAVRGRGHGHGAGLCQNGSHVLATRNYSALRIIQHYFTGTQVRPLGRP